MAEAPPEAGDAGAGSVAPTTQGNRATFFDDGTELFEEMGRAIRGARRRVWVETFVFTPDATGRETIRLLADAARRGCDVVLLFDQVGSHVTSLGFYRPVVDAGGRVAIFNPLPPWRRYGRRLQSFVRHRDHRKIVIVDDVGFCGGHNFSGSYMGPPPHHFYDMTVRYDGPCVRELAGVFLHSLRTTTGESRPPPAAQQPFADGAPAQVLGLHTREGVCDLVDGYTHLLEGAREEVLLILAYFAPDARLAAPILAAARRGVRVTLLTAGKADFVFPRLGGQHTFDPLLEAGVRIHQLMEPLLHAKAIVVDGESCMVGSFDLNRFELRNLAEVAVVTRDRALAARIHEGFRSCLERSEEVTLEERRRRSRPMRLLERLSYAVMR